MRQSSNFSWSSTLFTRSKSPSSTCSTISSVTRSIGKPTVSDRRAKSRAKFSTARSAGVMLSDRRRPSGQLRAPCSARSAICRDSCAVWSARSAIWNRAPAPTLPMTGWCHRASASAPIMASSASENCGWKRISISSRSIAASRSASSSWLDRLPCATTPLDQAMRDPADWRARSARCDNRSRMVSASSCSLARISAIRGQRRKFDPPSGFTMGPAIASASASASHCQRSRLHSSRASSMKLPPLSRAASQTPLSNSSEAK